MSRYQEFLRNKARVVSIEGIPEPYDLPEALFPFQRDVTAWALRKGRAAVWLDCGLGKSIVQLSWAHEVARHTGERVLILAPLAVSRQTEREGAKFNLPVQIVRDQSQVDGQVVITNYEMLEHMDPVAFGGVVLDESGILKSLDGKTRTRVTESFSSTPFRLACTATPAPNDFMELGNHSEFLGLLSRSEMLAEFFVHDGGETQKWRLKGHAEAEFWKWICEWAVAMRRPSDLGYQDNGFILPPLNIVHHVTANDDAAAQAAGKLFAMDAHTLDERRAARRGSIDERVRVAAEMANASTEPWIIWVDFNAEGDAVTKMIPGAVQVAGSDSTDDKVDRLIGFLEGRHRVLVSKASMFGYGLNLQMCHNMIFCGLSDSYERFYQAVRRCWRFGQKHEMTVYVITSGAEGAVVKNIQRKESAAQGMSNAMIKHMATKSAEALRGREVSVNPINESITVPPWLKSGID